jgi:hypothetical protein
MRLAGDRIKVTTGTYMEMPKEWESTFDGCFTQVCRGKHFFYRPENLSACHSCFCPPDSRHHLTFLTCAHFCGLMAAGCLRSRLLQGGWA